MMWCGFQENLLIVVICGNDEDTEIGLNLFIWMF
jgi:hypothetical protein